MVPIDLITNITVKIYNKTIGIATLFKKKLFTVRQFLKSYRALVIMTRDTTTTATTIRDCY